jgi:hypothetical protein
MSSTENSNTNYIIIIESGKPDESSKGKSYRRLIPSIMYWLEGIGLPASEVGDSDSTTSLDHSLLRKGELGAMRLERDRDDI